MSTLYEDIISTLGQDALAACIKSAVPDSRDPVGYSRHLKSRGFIPSHIWPALADGGHLAAFPAGTLEAAEIEYQRHHSARRQGSAA